MENKKTAGICKTFLFIFTIIFFSYLVNSGSCDGNFKALGSNPKYDNTWITTITCEDYDGNHVTIGNGNSWEIPRLVSERIDELGLPYQKPKEAIRRSTGAEGGGFKWTDYGTVDTNTVTSVCKILGYEKYVSSTCRDNERSSRYPNGKCNFHSPEDNQMYYFSGDVCIYECSDNIDNDGDGLIDEEDPGCWTDTSDPNTYDPKLDDESRADPECIADSDCPESYSSSRFCQGEDVYIKNYDYSCSTSYSCIKSTDWELIEECDYECDNGQCKEPPKECDDDVDNDGDGLIDEEDPGCWNDPADPSTYDPELDDESAYDIACFEDNDCGTTTLFDTICKNSDVFNLFLEPQCKNPGTGLASCETTINEEFKQSCDYGCANGQCFGECDTEADCGGDTYSEKFCNDNNDVYKIFYDVSCEDHVCSESSSWIFVEGCDYGCSNGECIGECSVDSDCGEDYTSDKYCGDDDNVYQDEYKVYCSDDNVCKEELYETVLIEECSHGCTDGTCDDFADDQGPIIEIISPEDGEVVNGVVNFSYTAEDEKSSVRNCSLVVEDKILQTSTTISTQTNSFTESFSQEKEYTFFISCFDTQDNYAESETREFTYEILECTCDLDCGDPSERHYCEGDNLMEEINTPICINNTCETEQTVDLVRECIDGCMNGVCLSDSQDDEDDDVNGGGSDDDDCEDCEEDTQVSFSENFKKNETAISFGDTRYSLPNNSNKKTLKLQDKSIDVLNEKENGFSWWTFWIILLILAIIIVLIIIMFIVAR